MLLLLVEQAYFCVAGGASHLTLWPFLSTVGSDGPAWGRTCDLGLCPVGALLALHSMNHADEPPGAVERRLLCQTGNVAGAQGHLPPASTPVRTPSVVHACCPSGKVLARQCPHWCDPSLPDEPPPGGRGHCPTALPSPGSSFRLCCQPVLSTPPAALVGGEVVSPVAKTDGSREAISGDERSPAPLGQHDVLKEKKLGRWNCYAWYKSICISGV